MHFNAKISTKPLPGLSLKTFSVLFLIIFLGLQKPVAQVAEDFSDGELSSNPSWVGSTGSFIVNNASQLQLNAAVAGTSWLSTPFPSAVLEEVSWEIFVKQSFAPSGANFARFYLVSDQQDVSSSLNGFYLQFGEPGSNDAVELFRQAGTGSISICRATNARIATSFEITIQVTRDGQGMWKVLIDYAGGRDFVLEASGSDPTQISSPYSGILCTYTITNATRFYFDDISIQSVKAPDNSPPQIASVEVISGQSLKIAFTEDVDRSSAENHLNYFVSPTAGNPLSVRLEEDGKTVELFFSRLFANGEPSSISVNGISDLSGNIMVATEKTFLFFSEYPVNFRDIIITEICADPSPALSMPEAEFVEVYNRGEHPVDLAGWQLADGSAAGKAGSFILLPGKYLVLAAPPNIERFSAFGQTLSVSPFPSLNNSGDLLKLKNDEGKTIDSVRYHISWYRDNEKTDGGWSLELIDIQNTCAEGSNWAAAENSFGGTPGQQNSIYANKPDNTGPGVIAVVLIDSSSLFIQFDEKLETTIPAHDQFRITPSVGISSVYFGDESFSSIVLLFSEQVQSSQTYIVQISDVYDCPGNKIREEFSHAEFELSEKAEPGDVLVNEILFNPRSTGVDFVEIHNHTQKTINLKNWTLRNFFAAGKNSTLITDEDLLLRAGAYKVFTEDGDILKGEYISGVENTFYETDLPALNDDDGSLTLIDGNGYVIDTMAYTDQMHVPFLRDDEGVSLERISVYERGTALSNWRSASSMSGFATPGYVNSNVRQDSSARNEAITVEPEIFQPTGPSRAFARINYRFDTGGLIANVRIFDQHGRPIKEIAGNELLGTEGFFRWDGDQDNGTTARTGYYVIWFEIFDAVGKVKTFRKRIALY